MWRAMSLSRVSAKTGGAGVRPGGGQRLPGGGGRKDRTGVAVDGAGDVFIADSSNNRVVEVPYLGNGTYGTQTDVPRLGLHGPQGVAVDGAGDVFIADFGNSRVAKRSKRCLRLWRLIVLPRWPTPPIQIELWITPA